MVLNKGEKMLKKIACTLAAVGFLAGATSAFGASRASLFLVGQIEIICDLFVNPTLGGVDTLDIEGGETDRLVATVDEETNNPLGYTIGISSVNTGVLLHNDAVSSVAYTIKYDGALVGVAPGAPGVPVIVKTTAAAGTANSDVEITTVVPGGALPAGAYTDTLIFTMVAL